MNLRAALKLRHPYAIAILIVAIIVTDTFNTSIRRMFISHPSRDTFYSLPFDNIKPEHSTFKKEIGNNSALSYIYVLIASMIAEKTLTAINSFFSILKRKSYNRNFNIEGFPIKSIVY